MGSKAKIPNCIVISFRMSEDDFERLREIAALETLNTGKVVTSHELIRQAIKYVYDDNERLRESFRRSRVFNKNFRLAT